MHRNNRIENVVGPPASGPVARGTAHLRSRTWHPALLAFLLVIPGCSRPSPHFSEANARAHVNMLAGTIGTRWVGTAGNARARAYLADQLRLYGFDVRVEEADAERPERGTTTRVSNIIAAKAGSQLDAIALVAHYDSASNAPGATDDALGSAVCVEAGRVLAARPDPTYSLMILLTDGEEAGLMGAAVIATDAAISIVLTAVRFAVFGLSGVVDAKVLAFALLIGTIAFPGAFLAKALVHRLPIQVHTAILDVVVLIGGAVMVAGAFVR